MGLRVEHIWDIFQPIPILMEILEVGIDEVGVVEVEGGLAEREIPMVIVHHGQIDMDRERIQEMKYALKKAKEILSDEKDLIFELIMEKYIGFKIKKEGVCLVVYPHRTGQRNILTRVRDESSKNILEYNRLQQKLYASEFNLMFYSKGGKQ